MTLALWAAVGHWNAWFDCMLYMTEGKYVVVQQYIQRIVNENASAAQLSDLATGNTDVGELTKENLKSASIMVTVLPILMFYPFIQRYFIKGVSLGAVKG